MSQLLWVTKLDVIALITWAVCTIVFVTVLLIKDRNKS